MTADHPRDSSQPGPGRAATESGASWEAFKGSVAGEEEPCEESGALLSFPESRSELDEGFLMKTTRERHGVRRVAEA